MNPGELNKRICIMTTVSTPNDNGYEEDQETIYCDCWAKVSNMSGTEIFKSNKDYSKVITRFLIRYRKDKIITTDMKVRFNNILYDITYVNNYKYSNEFLEIIGEVIGSG